MTLTSGTKKSHDFHHDFDMTLLFLNVQEHDDISQSHDFHHDFFMTSPASDHYEMTSLFHVKIYFVMSVKRSVFRAF